MVLAISALDLDKRLIVLALACVEKECTESWIYLFSLFSRTAVGQLLLKGGRMIIMSDRDGGLLRAALTVFPLTISRFCVVHIIKNAKNAEIKADWSLFVKIARTGSTAERDMLMIQLQQSSPKLVTWLHQNLKDWQWQLCPLVAVGYLMHGQITNNVAEVTMAKLRRPGSDFIQSLREKTPGPMLQEAVNLFSLQAEEKRSHARTLSVRAQSEIKLFSFMPAAQRMFMRQQNESKFYGCTERGPNSFAVSRKDSRAISRIVMIDANGCFWCSCCFYQQFRIVCRHILAVWGNKREYRSHLKRGGIGEMWLVGKYVRAFAEFQAPVPTKEEIYRSLEQTEFPRNVKIPPPVAQRGRPRKKRRKSAQEQYRAMALKRGGVSAGTPCVVCGICSKLGHNMRTCPLLKDFES